MVSRQSQRQIVGLRTGIDEIADGQIARHGVHQPLGTGHQVVVQEPTVGGQQTDLSAAGVHDARMAVTNYINVDGEYCIGTDQQFVT